ncbi:hypothetical protein A0H81_11239 [Grifola frondosa]|uniref:BBC1/AIM3 cysteine proteinase-fold domain-containing protein n=1 Tax=Grifola frondosa TaxID=5627 RepID=A0A1C7LWC6_GRIFR|nr:hypothetical protein A0H81_11239 [Grifola frondosa]
MSDPPPKKLGSLRDRIAAFENKGSAPAPASPPAPRPKPGNLSWKPKPLSPPQSPSDASSDHGHDPDKRASGMSAADAKESMKGVSLKERMAALQGLNSFGGGSAAPLPPKPAVEKPKWKPPPVVAHAEADSEDHDDVSPSNAHADASEADSKSPNDDEQVAHSQSEEAQEELDPKEEERQRRAALAARMARLGGARVGMGPPIFAKKPNVPAKKVEVEQEDAEKHVEPGSAEVTSEGPVTQSYSEISVPIPLETSGADHSADYVAGRKDSATSSLLSTDSASSTATPRSPAMPVPVVPRRTAPPRKRPAKSPSPAAQAVLEGNVHESPSPIPPTASDTSTADHEAADTVEATEEFGAHGDLQPEIRDTQAPAPIETVEVTDVVVDQEHFTKERLTEHTAEPVETPDHEVIETPSSPAEEERRQGPEIEHTEHVLEADEHARPEYNAITGVLPAAEQVTYAAPEQEEEQEEDEASRRKRIAERLAKMGGFNPLSGPPPPPRRDSAEVLESPISPPSLRSGGQQEHSASPPVEKPAVLRKGSTDSATSRHSLPLLPTSPKPELPTRKGSVGSVRSNISLESPVRRSSQDDHRPVFAESTISEEPLEQSTIVEEADEDEDNATRAHREASYDQLRRSIDEGERYDESESDHEDVLHEPDEGFTGVISDDHDHIAPTVARAPVPSVTHELTIPHPAHVARALPSVPSIHDQDTNPSPRQQVKRQSLPPPRAIPPPPPHQEDIHEGNSVGSSPVHEYAVQHVTVESRHGTVLQDGVVREQPDEVLDQEDTRGGVSPALTTIELEEQSEDAHYEEDHAEAEAQYEPELEHEEPEYEEVPPPPPPRTSVHVLPSSIGRHEELEMEEEVPPPPPPRTSVHARHSLIGQQYEDAEAEQSLPPPPPRTSIHVPRPSVKEPNDLSASPPQERKTEALSHIQGVEREPQLPPLVPSNRPTRHIPPPLAQLITPEREILNDEDGDPIDPDFYSPLKSAGSPSSVLSSVSRAPAPHLPRRQHLRFAFQSSLHLRHHYLLRLMFRSSPLPLNRKRRRRKTLNTLVVAPLQSEWRNWEGLEPSGSHTEERNGQSTPAESERETEDAPPEEEDEFARKQRIAARIAGMGGMRFGMSAVVPPQQPSRVDHDQTDEGEVSKSPAPRRSIPLPPPPPAPAVAAVEGSHEEDSDYHHVSDSEQVHPEDSEVEEITHADVEEAPPPVPSRAGRRMSAEISSPPVPSSATRPLAVPPPVPVVSSRPNEAEAEDEPPPPPPRTARAPPPRSGTLPPLPPATAEDVIPDVDFGAGTDLSLSGQWSEDPMNYPPPAPSKPHAPVHIPSGPPNTSHPPPAELHLSADDLMAQWGRVGIQVHEAATALFEKSKKSVVGDGTYVGFVTTAIAQIPNAAKPGPPFDSFGYLFYAQTGASVQKRASDIMPGDIILLHEAKFKGHKGLQSYHQNIGIGEPLVAIIADFETKKSKVKVFQANQHVGQQSVESASYRLDDMKSGTIQIFRVLEA